MARPGVTWTVTGTWISSPATTAPSPACILNRGNGHFFETAPQVLTWRNRPRADTHGGSWADYDNDGDQDLLVSSGTGNLSQLLVNEHARLVDRTIQRGLTTANVGGRLPVWLDYNGDKRPTS